MTGSLTLRVITPERIVLDVPTDSVRFPGIDGSVGVLPGHAALVAALGPGELSYEESGKRQQMFVAGGFAEVRSNTVRIVTEASESPTEIDVDRAQRASERAKERLHEMFTIAGAAQVDAFRARAALQRALMRLSMARR
ncbi:MAG: F-type H+-transporting ATPase subunit epsilon [Chlamydiales bacterium]|jgi:F-type H+-transporting ATPase subunit epsilon